MVAACYAMRNEGDGWVFFQCPWIRIYEHTNYTTIVPTPCPVSSLRSLSIRAQYTFPASPTFIHACTV